jgi:acetate kinase
MSYTLPIIALGGASVALIIFKMQDGEQIKEQERKHEKQIKEQERKHEKQIKEQERKHKEQINDLESALASARHDQVIRWLKYIGDTLHPRTDSNYHAPAISSTLFVCK